jgi:hypothetical protein
MVLLDTSEVHTIPLEVYFSFKIHFKRKFFKMSSVRFHFSPGFPAQQNTHVVLCVNSIPPEQKNRFPEVLCVF